MGLRGMGKLTNMKKKRTKLHDNELNCSDIHSFDILLPTLEDLMRAILVHTKIFLTERKNFRPRRMKCLLIPCLVLDVVMSKLGKPNPLGDPIGLISQVCQ